MSSTSAAQVCSSVPEIRVLGMGIGFFLYLLLILFTISLIVTHHDKKRIGKQLGFVHLMFLLIIILMPKKSTKVEECGPRADSQGLLTVVMTFIQAVTAILALLGVFLQIGSKSVITVSKEDRATGHTSADNVFF
mmetsp:Transcript_16968/g.42063  ORF Transcript_16968/g.42063 Transcript_16968/m.42063 type:complete len:135 (+) Transcript_16968:247-651(+)|eukprot:CAMPEP_0178989970 /NCGR_PEP_ID=MMETSP0795-20121207/4671_1 /TAXON_ID=88552 /ORGANISM="Amoebophrya sp., Strain Ameob2" /LENGTH=134 /DNA_ID=CAMNT_0020681433 /DNA_START=230 /DNA_END=634 /DNA_ORIENTATION=-